VESDERHVGLFGGSFNPPHICHVLASRYVLDHGLVDAVWWLPVHRHAFAKDSGLAPWEHRLAMSRAVAEVHEGIEVDEVEAGLTPPSYTFDTIAALRAEHPRTRFSWIIGTDILDDLPGWYRWEELRDILDFLVIGRGSGEGLAPEGGRFTRLDLNLPDLSSTSLREQLAKGRFERVRKAVPGPVADYLKEHPDLYR
jgi:nicotinate-nucleotide adenylyltransferase